MPLDKEARVKEACVETKEELEGRETRKEANRSAEEVGHGGVVRERDYVKERVNDNL